MFFSARRITSPLFRRVQTRIHEALKSRSRIAQSHIVDAVFDLSAIAIVLPFDASRFASAFGGSGFINSADGLRVSVFRGDNLLAAISQHLLIPDQGFEKTLQCPRCDILIESDGFRDCLQSNL